MDDIVVRLELHQSWCDSHGELNDAPNLAATEITTLRAKLAQAEAETQRIKNVSDDHFRNSRRLAERCVKAEADAARVVEWLRAGVSHRPDIDADIADLIERGAHKEPTP